MKFSILMGLALLAGPLTFNAKEAHAYSSPEGADPDHAGFGNGDGGNMSYDIETKGIKKTVDASESEALIAGLIVGYDPGRADGYTVTRAIPQTEVGQKTFACITTDAVATGDVGYHRCITKGFAKIRYNGTGTKAPAAGRAICADASGIGRACDLGSAMEATADTGIRALESKTGSGSDLRVLINLQ